MALMLMLQLAALHSADAGVYMLPWNPGTHRELLQSDALAPSAEGLAELSATTAAPQTIAEVAADTICGAKEYYCGTSDIVLDAAYSALAAGGCTNNTGEPVLQCATQLTLCLHVEFHKALLALMLPPPCSSLKEHQTPRPACRHGAVRRPKQPHSHGARGVCRSGASAQLLSL